MSASPLEDPFLKIERALLWIANMDTPSGDSLFIDRKDHLDECQYVCPLEIPLKGYGKSVLGGADIGTLFTNMMMMENIT